MGRHRPHLSLCFLAAGLWLADGGGRTLAADIPDAGLIERGRYLAIAGDCVACHTAPGGKPFAGGGALQTPFGTILATNITPSKTHGIASYTLAQFTDAVRKGIRADGKYLYPAMPYTAYALVSDDDIGALYAYFMHGVGPVDEPSPNTSLPFPFNIRLLMAAWNLLFLDDTRFHPESDKSEAWNRGAYLVRGLAHCGVCHTPRNLLMGEKASRALGGTTLDTWFAPNITSDPNSGLGSWSDREVVDYLRLGHAGGKSQAAGPMAEAIDNSLRHLNETDLNAIAVYLKTVRPIRNDGDDKPPFAWGQASDELDAVRGAPLPSDPNQMSGAQIYDAYCATCHQERGQGSFDGGLPPLFHNTSLGRQNTDNVVMVILDGVHRTLDRPEILMPGFARELSDQQIAMLGTYLIEHYGNPNARITIDQVSQLRKGGVSSPMLKLFRIGVAAGIALIAVAAAYYLFRWRRRRA